MLIQSSEWGSSLQSSNILPAPQRHLSNPDTNGFGRDSWPFPLSPPPFRHFHYPPSFSALNNTKHTPASKLLFSAKPRQEVLQDLTPSTFSALFLCLFFRNTDQIMNSGSSDLPGFYYDGKRTGTSHSKAPSLLSSYDCFCFFQRSDAGQGTLVVLHLNFEPKFCPFPGLHVVRSFSCFKVCIFVVFTVFKLGIALDVSIFYGLSLEFMFCCYLCFGWGVHFCVPIALLKLFSYV